MATNYPDGYDTFNEPSQPEQTALNQVGGQAAPGRNHFEHHRDLGDAVEQLQQHAARRGHDHSGSSTDPARGAKLAQANTHEGVDTNASASAIHHTLATHLPTSGTTGQFQAASGHHTHDYNTLTNKPWHLCTSATRPTGVAPGTMIYETDTNRVRVWSQFSADNLAVTGLNAADSFDRLNTDNMGSTLWQQIYTPGSAGKMGTDGNHLAWYDSGNDPARCIARRINAADRRTSTDDQIMIWLTGGFQQEYYTPFYGATAPSNDFYFRMSDDSQSYLRLVSTYNEWGQGSLTLFGTKTGPGGERRIGSLSADTFLINTYWTAELIGNTMTISCGPTLEGSTIPVGKIVDVNGVANKGSSYRGWGVGMVAGNRTGLDTAFGQVTPAEISMVIIQDVITYTGTALWQLLPVANTPTVRLSQNISGGQQINAGGTLVRWNEEIEDTFGYFNPAFPTKITIADPGLYHFSIGLQWGTSFIPETATAVICRNSEETLIRKSSLQTRSGLLSLLGINTGEDYSETMAFSGTIRLSAGDEVTVKCRYNADTLSTFINTYFDAQSRVKSRLEMHYIGP